VLALRALTTRVVLLIRAPHRATVWREDAVIGSAVTLARDATDTMFLVSCVGKKGAAPSRARDLYTSDWFHKARAYVEARGDRWFILSAECGLLHPDTVVAPYERTLNRMGIAERRAWAARVLAALEPQLAGVGRVVVLAGERYREFILGRLRELTPVIEIPLAGLRIGEQLGWLARHQRA
jgi:hypothetical protein